MSNPEHLQGGRYVILKKVGEGGRGIVYKARDTVLNRVVAIKMLKSAGITEEAYSRFMSEAQAFAKLDHPNVVSIHDIGKEDDAQFFVTEFIDGMNLRDLMGTYPEGKCDVQTVLRIGIDVCSALQYAHSQGVLHRDVKPENILINKEGIAKLNDFGLAKILGQPSLTQEGIIVGTVAYVAPEIALGKGADARSDLYSFGAVLYETVAGRPPFVGQDAVNVIFSHIHDYPVSPSKLNPRVPQALTDCIVKLLEKDPEKRYQTAADLLVTLRGIAESFAREALVPSHKPGISIPSPRRSALKESLLIDRVEEMDLLRGAVDRAVRGEGGVVFLHGEAGIGKTRLSRELEAYARLRGMQVLFGRCPALFRMDGAPPYALWSEVIKDYLQACPPEKLYKVIGFYPGEVSKLVPEVRQKLGVIPESPPIDPEHGRDRLFEAVSQFIINISKEAPLLVVLDDLQWTDQSSLLLLHYLARGVSKEALLFLGNYRDTDVDQRHPLSPVLTELNRERFLQSIQLKRMSFNDVSEMIKQILEQDDVPREFCELMYEKTRGNPFFVEEVIKSLKEEEVIYREQNEWRIKEVSRIEFPETVKSVVKTRITRLDDACQNALTMASFIGKDFSFGALRGVTGLEDDKLLGILEKMLNTGLIKERLIRREEVYSFADIMVRDIVHEEVSLLRHKRLHSAVGSALESVYAKRIDDHLGELAYHFLEGGDEDRALDYFLKAGENVEKIYAHNEAVSYFKSALRILQEKNGDLRENARILESLGNIEHIVGERVACMKHWNDALLLCEQLDEKGRTSRLRNAMAFALWEAGDIEKAVEHSEKALALSAKILETEPKGIESASLYIDMAYMYWIIGDDAKILSCAEKALELAEELNASEVITHAYRLLGNWTEDKKKQVEYLQKAVKIALDNGYAWHAARAYYFLAMRFPGEENERRLECWEKGLELTKRVGHIAFQSEIGHYLALMYLNMGNINKAILLLEESVALSRKTAYIALLPSCLLNLGYAYQVSGEWNKSEQYYKEALSISQGLDEYPVSRFLTYAFLGRFHVDKGEYATAKEFFEKMHDIFEKGQERARIGMDVDWPHIVFAVTYLELGEMEKAKDLIDLVHAHALKRENKELIASVDLLRAMLFRAQKRWEESIELFEKALQEFEALNARRWNVYTFGRMALCEYARVYLERNLEGDREKAHKLLDQALEIFQRMGAKKDIERIIAKKRLLTA